MRQPLRLIGINLAVFVAIFGLLEMAVRLFNPDFNDHRQFRETRPAPYQSAPYFSERFLRESFEQPGGYTTPPGRAYLLPNDYRGEYFNVRQHLRVTTGVPADATRRILMFGGSTLYSSEVPDAYTIASQLQRLVNRHGLPYAVINYGVSSLNSVQQLERLRDTPLRPGDIVVFYDGVNEVIQGVLYENAGDTIASNNNNRPAWQKQIARLAKHSALARLLLGNMQKNFVPADIPRLAARTTERYRRNLDLAEAHAQARQTRFFHFLQPTLFTLGHHKSYETTLAGYSLNPPQAGTVFSATYPLFNEMVAERAATGHADFDLSKHLDRLGQPVYLDFCHVNHIGNQAIAESIYQSLRPSLLASDPS